MNEYRYPRRQPPPLSGSGLLDEHLERCVNRALFVHGLTPAVILDVLRSPAHCGGRTETVLAVERYLNVDEHGRPLWQTRRA